MKTWTGTLLLLAVAAAASCAQDLPVRSFVQPNLLKKSDMVGTWHYLQTAIDAPATNGSMFTGLSSELIKGKFDIQLDYLYFRRSYEQIGGSEDLRQTDGNGYYGQPLAAWKITSHFDVIRDYSATTGEQTNRVVESQERPWEEREFVRVDWSQNLVTDYVGVGLNLFFDKSSGVTVQPVSYWDADPNSPDGIYKEFQTAPVDAQGMPLSGPALTAAQKAAKFAADEMTYFDITNKILLTPQEVSVDFGDGTQASFPKCLLANVIDDCASQLVKVRHAFAKISPKHDYIPRNWDGVQMERFGIWDVGLNRLTYNREYGVTNSGFSRHAARFNLWEQSYPVDGNGMPQMIACDDDTNPCQNGLVCGSLVTTLDPTQTADTRYCEIAPADRKLRTIPYYAQSSLRQRHAGKVGEYYDDIFGADLFDTGKEVVQKWNEALKAAYTDATKDRTQDRLLADDNTGKTAPNDILTFCHVPVKMVDDAGGPKDDPACWRDLQPLASYDSAGNVVNVLDDKGNLVYRPRQGDPRRSTIFWVNEEQVAGPLGYGPPLFDPQTGETVSGQAYIYGAALDTYASRSRDLALLLINQISTSDYIKGVNVDAWVNSNRLGPANQNQGNTVFTHDQLMNRSLAMDFSWARGLAPESKIDHSSVQGLMDSIRAREERLYATGVYGTGQGNPAVDRKNHLRDQPIESMMIQPDQLTGLGRGAPVQWEALSDSEKAHASPLRSGVVDDAIKQRFDLMTALGVDFADFYDEGIYQRVLLAMNHTGSDGTKDLIDATNTRCDDGQGHKTCFAADKLRQYLRQQIFLGVTLHEVGHNMGLRHNFRASYDAMNYFPDYWQLRDKGKGATKTCQGQPFDAPVAGDPNEGKLRPRYINRPGGATSDIECQGSIREFQYSSIMDYGAEFNSDLHGLGSYDKAAMKFSYAEYYEAFTDARADSLGKFAALQNASSSYGLPTPIEPDPNGFSFNAITYTRYPDFFNSGVPGIAKRVDVPVELARNSTAQQNTVYGVKVGNKLMPIVPYYFCSDEFVGNLTCQRFDAGADVFEQAQDLVSRYNNFYLVNNFKRDRYPFYVSSGYMTRIRDRYFEILRQQLTWYALLRSEFQDDFFQYAQINNTDPNQVLMVANDFFAKEDQWGSFTAGVTMGFDLLGEVISRPSFGSFVKVPGDSNHQAPYWKQFSDTPYGNSTLRNIPIGQGRHEATTWDFTGCGYYWYDECTTRIGYLLDKTQALQVLTDSQAYFTGRDTSTDVRKYAIGYYRVFPTQMQEKLGALLSGDYAAYAPRFMSATTANNYNVGMWSWTTGQFNAPTLPTEDDIVEPATGFTLQINAGVNALANISSGFDQSIIQNTQIFIVGNGEAPVADSLLVNGADAKGNALPGPLATTDPSGVKSACDPKALTFNSCVTNAKGWFIYTSTNGRTYAARSVPKVALQTITGLSDQSMRMDTGTRMISMLSDLETKYQAAVALPANNPDRDRLMSVAKLAVDNYVQNIEVIRSLHKAFGYGPFKTDTPFYY